MQKSKIQNEADYSKKGGIGDGGKEERKWEEERCRAVDMRPNWDWPGAMKVPATYVLEATVPILAAGLVGNISSLADGPPSDTAEGGRST